MTDEQPNPEDNPMFGVIYRRGLRESDYDEAIRDLQAAKTQTEPIKCAYQCAVCGDGGHLASQCHHNPLVMARRAARAARVWRCYHCDFVAYTHQQAEEHFGTAPGDEPSCFRGAVAALVKAILASTSNRGTLMVSKIEEPLTRVVHLVEKELAPKRPPGNPPVPDPATPGDRG